MGPVCKQIITMRVITNISLQFINSNKASVHPNDISLPPSVLAVLEDEVVSFDHAPEEHRVTHRKDHSLRTSSSPQLSVN